MKVAMKDERCNMKDVTPVFKKEYRNLVKNYRHISVFPVVLKIFERKLQKQVSFSIYMWIQRNDREMEKKNSQKSVRRYNSNGLK